MLAAIAFEQIVARPGSFHQEIFTDESKGYKTRS